MSYRHNQRRKEIIAVAPWSYGAIDWRRANTQGNLPRAHSAKAAPHPMAGATPPPKPRKSSTMPVCIVDEPVEWVMVPNDDL